MRLHNWHPRFIDYIVQSRIKARNGKMPFCWDPHEGENCMTFCSGAVAAVTGKDVYYDLVGEQSYDSAIGAAKVLLGLGHRSVDELFASLFTPKPLPFLMAGDLITVPADGIDVPELDNFEARQQLESMGRAGAVVDPPHFYCFLPTGLARGHLSMDAQMFSAYGVN